MLRLWIVSRQVLTNLLFPVTLLAWLASEQYSSFIEWLLLLGGITTFVAYRFIAGVWAWFTVYFRYLLIVAWLGVALWSSRNLAILPFLDEASLTMFMGVILLAVFAPLVVVCLRGCQAPRWGLPIAFPLHKGLYYVAQGGSSLLLNQHSAAAGACRGVDIVKLDRAGFRARGVYPARLNEYYIYGEPVFSPVAGVVVAAVDDKQDMLPGVDDLCCPAGNYIILRLNSSRLRIYLMHLQSGSVAVNQGDLVSTGQFLGRVGNSGVSTEPHLHIHCAVDKKEWVFRRKGVPLLFDGHNLRRNSLFRGATPPKSGTQS